MQDQKLILGIDPGSRKTGYGLIAVLGKSIKYIDSGTIKLGNGEFLERLQILKNEITEVLNKYRPSEIAMESLIYVKSPTALIKLAQARGVILSCLVQEYSQNFYEYSPNLVKSSSVGHGHADKQGVQKAIQMITGVSEFETDDESDALAVAICHALNAGKASIPKAKKSKGKGLAASLAHKLKEV